LSAYSAWSAVNSISKSLILKKIFSRRGAEGAVKKEDLIPFSACSAPLREIREKKPLVAAPAQGLWRFFVAIPLLSRLVFATDPSVTAIPCRSVALPVFHAV
jgi:hypothetical protein